MVNELRTNEVMSLIAGLPVAEDNTRENRPSLEEAESFFRKVIEARINHCVNNLKAHANEAKVAFSIVVWPTGHFSVPVYESLVEAQKSGLEGLESSHLATDHSPHGRRWLQRRHDVPHCN